MNYVMIIIGALLSFLSYRWSFFYMCNPNYWRLKGRSEVTQLCLETASNVVFFCGFGLIIFSSGFRLSRIVINLGIVGLLHFVVFPILGPRLWYLNWLGKAGESVNTSKEIRLDTDKEWSVIDGEFCRVLQFTPYSSVKNGKIHADKLTEPYAHAILTLERKKVQGTMKGYIWHKIDFRNLWKVFKERTVQENEEVIIIWTKQNYKYTLCRYFSYFMPKLWIAIFPKGRFELLADPSLRPKSMSSKEKLELHWPIEEFKPDIMR